MCFLLYTDINPMPFLSPFSFCLRLRPRRFLPPGVALPVLLLASPLSFAGTDHNDAGSVTTLDRLAVQGTRAQRTAYQGNLDLTRTENDAQPYTFLGRERIERSGATSVEDLLRQQLTMSTAFASSDNSPGGFGGASSKLSLRGLDASQTLVLVNGRRVAGVGRRGSSEGSDQADLNGIPLSAIERIEILPASASAIYGSSALGGVINVVLRQDYSGHEVNARYETTDDGHAPIETYNLTSSFQFEQGRSQVLFSAQYSETEPLQDSHRRFQLRGRAHALHHHPDSIYIPEGKTGSPPHGALVNLRSADGRPLFGPGSSHFTHLPKGYRGWQLDGLQPLIDNQGRYNLDWVRGAVNGFTAERYLIGMRRSKSGNLSASRQMGAPLRVFLDLGWSESRETTLSTSGTGVFTLYADSPNNPFGQDVRITFPLRHEDRLTPPFAPSIIRQLRAGMGFEWELSRQWRIVGDYAWSYSYNDYSFRRAVLDRNAPTNAVNAGLVDLLRDTTSFPTLIDPYYQLPHSVTKAWQAESTVRVLGTVAQWAAGDITLASGIEHRELRSFGYPEYALPPRITYRRQQADSLYAETTVPLVSPQWNIPGVYSMDVQLAWRYEHFDVESVGQTFQTTVPTFGLRWLPFEDFIVRVSWGKGFRAPTYSQLANPTRSSEPITLNDPRRGGEANAMVFTLGGGNPDLEPETSRNLNLGIVWTPDALSGLRLSADWYRIEKKNNLTSLSAQTILDQEAIFPDRVIRAAPEPGEPWDVGRVTQVNTYMMNMLKMETQGLDLAARYLWQSDAWGDLDLALAATFTDFYREQSAFGAPLVDWVGIPAHNSVSPIKTRINASVVWNHQQWSAGWAAQYYDSYHIDPGSLTAILGQGRDTVASQTYHDVFIRYRAAAYSGVWGGLEFTFGIKNLFDKVPPIDMSRTTFYYSTFGDPRLRRLYVNVKKNF